MVSPTFSNTVGFSGTQRGLKQPQIFRLTHLMKWLREEQQFLYLGHGDCIGADHEADYLWHGLDGKVAIYPPLNEAKRAFCALHDGDVLHAQKDYIPRNHDIVDDSSRMIICPNTMHELRRGSGTWATFRYANILGRLIHVVFPNGGVQNYNVPD